MTDAYIHKLWLAAGGRFHGPIVETATITERRLYEFVRAVATAAAQMAIETERATGNTGKEHG